MKVFIHERGKIVQDYNAVKIYRRTGKNKSRIVTTKHFQKVAEAIEYFNNFVKDKENGIK